MCRDADHGPWGWLERIATIGRFVDSGNDGWQAFIWTKRPAASFVESNNT